MVQLVGVSLRDTMLEVQLKTILDQSTFQSHCAASLFHCRLLLSSHLCTTENTYSIL